MNGSPLAWGVVLLGTACGQGPGGIASAGFGTGGVETGSATPGTGPTSAPDGTMGDGDSGGSEATDHGGPKLDVNGNMDVAGGPCSDEDGEVLFSNIWIANSAEGTVSKLDTMTLVEVGRFLTRADALGDPSRTSVSLAGDVAVANRSGGLIKILARAKECPDQNGDPGIQTSTGAPDILPWGTDDCVAWYIPLSYTSQRPVAWTPGKQDPETCEHHSAKVWTSGTVFNEATATSETEVLLVDGETGTIEATVDLPGLPDGRYGGYGGASDGDGNFWMLANDYPQRLVRVRLDDLSVDVYPVVPSQGGYGTTVDSKGRPWVAFGLAARFDPVAAAWSEVSYDWDPDYIFVGYGMQEGNDGRMWIAAYRDNAIPTGEPGIAGLLAIDIDTMQPGAFHQLPEFVKGVSVDVDGNVWGVSVGDTAYRVHPDTGAFDVYGGLSGAYTYSDMTGWALANAGHPPAG